MSDEYHGLDRRNGSYPKGVVPPHHPDHMPEHVTLADIWRLLHTHIQHEEQWRNELDQAFPVNKRTGKRDYGGHGEYHDKLIDRAVKMEERRARWVESALGGSIWAIGGLLLMWMGNGALSWLREHLFK